MLLVVYTLGTLWKRTVQGFCKHNNFEKHESATRRVLTLSEVARTVFLDNSDKTYVIES